MARAAVPPSRRADAGGPRDQSVRGAVGREAVLTRGPELPECIVCGRRGTHDQAIHTLACVPIDFADEGGS